MERTFPTKYKNQNPSLSGYSGDIDYLKDKNGNSYYKNHTMGDWIDMSNGNDITEQQLEKIIAEDHTK